ncbi:uncharacterized protein BDZ99DRAFT_527667 [Mytilinidion resinicola]|uniref:Uncharacterized protein n=1 Tax=Mytilinidion resinicola TaxID=574789 RepID=A0A6A6Y0X5_9PEZI|nr:uncharacterized protein BDZ99DRAFT_527667 [Mytilinidion resinicola]KAF2802300.1 hypothetical protein BDZ99DRAFT_527667 [Mytilinidion resinicola]
MVSTFSDGAVNETDWLHWKNVEFGGQVYFIPNIGEKTAGYYTSDPGWWAYWGPPIDGVFGWESAWPVEGATNQADVSIDNQVMGGSSKYPNGTVGHGKTYMIGLSLLQYKNAYNTNLYHAGELNLPKRMANIISMPHVPDFVQIQTWNDGPEGHYIGSIWDEQSDYKQTLSTSYCPNENYGFYDTKIAGYSSGADQVNYAISVPSSSTGLKVRYNSGTTQNLKPGLNYGSFPISTGGQTLEVIDGSSKVIVGGTGTYCVSGNCPEGFYNYNPQMVGLTVGGATNSACHQAGSQSVTSPGEFFEVYEPDCSGDQIEWACVTCNDATVNDPTKDPFDRWKASYADDFWLQASDWYYQDYRHNNPELGLLRGNRAAAVIWKFGGTNAPQQMGDCALVDDGQCPGLKCGDLTAPAVQACFGRLVEPNLHNYFNKQYDVLTHVSLSLSLTVGDFQQGFAPAKKEDDVFAKLQQVMSYLGICIGVASSELWSKVIEDPKMWKELAEDGKKAETIHTGVDTLIQTAEKGDVANIEALDKLLDKLTDYIQMNLNSTLKYLFGGDQDNNVAMVSVLKGGQWLANSGDSDAPFQALKGIEQLNGTIWGKLTKEDIAISSYMGYQLNGNKNGYTVSTDATSYFTDGAGTKGLYPFTAGLRTPGYYSYPICGTNEAYRN